MYVAKLKKYQDTENAVIITVEGLDRLGRADRRVFLPKSQIQIKNDPIMGMTIYIPNWLIVKNHIPWCKVTELDPISPKPR